MNQDPIVIDVEGIGELEFPEGTDPAVIQATVKRLTGGGDAPAPVASHGAEPETRTGPLWDQLKMAEDGQTMPILPGLSVVGQAPGVIRQLIGKMAPRVMRNSLGAQQGIRNKFPTVDLDSVALREGAVPGSARSIGAIGKASEAANSGIQEAARAADAGGSAPIQPRQIVSGFRKIYDRAGAARMPEDQADIVKAANEIRKQYRGGINRSDAITAKQEWATRAKGTLQGVADPRTANTGKKVAKAVTQGLTAASHTDPGVSQALTRSQELMALERAMRQTGNRTSVLRDALATASGATAGAVAGGPVGALITAPLVVAANRAATSPQLLGRLANVMNRTGQRPSSTELQALIAQLLAGIPHDPE